jgi:hypothetical protein
MPDCACYKGAEESDSADFVLPAPHKFTHDNCARTSKKEAIMQLKRYRAAAGLAISAEEGARWGSVTYGLHSSPGKVALLFQKMLDNGGSI